MSDNPHDAPQYEEYLTPEVTNWAMLCHLTALIGLMTGLFFLGPLIVWLLKRKDHPFIDEQGKESLNFQLSMLIYEAISAVLICVLIGFVFLTALVIADVVFVIIASMKVSSGEDYRYPLTIRFIR